MTTTSHTTSCVPSLWTGSADCCIEVKSSLVKYTDKEIVSEYDYQTTRATKVPVAEGGKDCWMAEPVTMRYTFKTQRHVPRVGVMLVGWGGNNGTTFTAGIIANALKLKWPSKYGQQSADWYGSLTQCGTVRLGSTTQGEQVHVPIKSILPMLDPTQIVVSGWDISGVNMAAAMNRASVLDYELQRALTPHMSNIKPLPSIYYPDFIASNQQDRADNLLPGNDKQAHLDTIREHIRQFRRTHQLDKVIVLWTANTERFAEVRPGLNDTADALLRSIATSANEVAPSTIFAVASILEGAPFINGSPQNTFVPGLIQLALKHGVFIAGDDFKTGQTKLKSVLVEYLVSAGLKPMSIVSYNHLGNNDGKNLAAPAQFRSKEISKSNVVDDMVASNRLLYRNGDTPDHTVVIKYVPYVGDTKRAMDEYISRIFLGGHNTLTISNICEDSLLAAPLILDLVILTELFSRISYKTNGMQEFEPFDPVLSVLSYLLKAPMVPAGSPVVNALAKQRYCLTNILRAAVGLPPDNDMLLEHKTKASLLRAKL